jgi:uncharacterized protein YbbK (DUF523 family)
MSGHPRPLVVISRCIDFDSCRYDGQVIRASLREQLEPHVDFVPICPELEIGLGVPRDPVRLVRRSGAAHMVQPASGRDVTAEMESFSRDFLSGLGTVDAFILKARSPSCGVRDAKLFDTDDDRAAFDPGPGLFAARVLERFPHAAVEDEAGMNDLSRRHHFLTKAFALAGVRAAAAAGLPRADPSVDEPYPPELARPARVTKRQRRSLREVPGVAP